MTRDDYILQVYGELAETERQNADVADDLEARAEVFHQLGEERLVAAALAAAEAIREFDREATRAIVRRMRRITG